MIDHVSIPVRSIDESVAFYDRVLQPLGRLVWRAARTMIRRPTLALLAWFAGAAVAHAAEEECIFDQAAQLRHYTEMAQRIDGARFHEAERLLIVERDAEAITVRRGGCVHFGLVITHTAPFIEAEAQRDAVFARAVALVAEFGGDDLVSASDVADAIRREDFEVVQDGLCYLRIPGVAAFSIVWGVAAGRLTVEVEYYIN